PAKIDPSDSAPVAPVADSASDVGAERRRLHHSPEGARAEQQADGERSPHDEVERRDGPVRRAIRYADLVAVDSASTDRDGTPCRLGPDDRFAHWPQYSGRYGAPTRRRPRTAAQATEPSCGHRAVP